MEYFYKKERNPYIADGREIRVYADLPAASFFHPGILKYLFFLIREDDVNIANEDNEISLFIRFAGVNLFRATLSTNQEDGLRAFNILTDGQYMSVTKDKAL